MTRRLVPVVVAVILVFVLSASTLYASYYSAEVLADNPIAYYRLSETSGTSANDSSPNNNIGTYVGTPTLGVGGAVTAAPPNNAVNFAALGRLDSVALFDPAATNWTVEFWINNVTIGEPKGVISQTDGTGTGRSLVYIENTGPGYFMSSFLGGADRFSGFGQLNNDTWYYAALVSTDQGSTSDLQWYLDGTPYNNYTAVTIESANGIFKIASDKTGAGVLNGILDEVAFYNSALSSSRIAEHYASRFTPLPEPTSFAMLAFGALAMCFFRCRRFGK